jgi:hypothetical protein
MNNTFISSLSSPSIFITSASVSSLYTNNGTANNMYVNSLNSFNNNNLITTSIINTQTGSYSITNGSNQATVYTLASGLLYPPSNSMSAIYSTMNASTQSNVTNGWTSYAGINNTVNSRGNGNYALSSFAYNIINSSTSNNIGCFKSQISSNLSFVGSSIS